MPLSPYISMFLNLIQFNRLIEKGFISYDRTTLRMKVITDNINGKLLKDQLFSGIYFSTSQSSSDKPYVLLKDFYIEDNIIKSLTMNKELNLAEGYSIYPLNPSKFKYISSKKMEPNNGRKITYPEFTNNNINNITSAVLKKNNEIEWTNANGKRKGYIKLIKTNNGKEIISNIKLKK